MAMARTRLNWTYDAATQTFTTPSGVVSLVELANCRYSMMTNSFDMSGPWRGWRMCGEKLRPPGGSRLPPLRSTMTALFLRWLREMETRDGDQRSRYTAIRLVALSERLTVDHHHNGLERRLESEVRQPSSR